MLSDEARAQFSEALSSWGMADADIEDTLRWATYCPGLVDMKSDDPEMPRGLGIVVDESEDDDGVGVHGTTRSTRVRLSTASQSPRQRSHAAGATIGQFNVDRLGIGSSQSLTHSPQQAARPSARCRVCAACWKRCIHLHDLACQIFDLGSDYRLGLGRWGKPVITGVTLRTRIHVNHPRESILVRSADPASAFIQLRWLSAYVVSFDRIAGLGNVGPAARSTMARSRLTRARTISIPSAGRHPRDTRHHPDHAQGQQRELIGRVHRLPADTANMKAQKHRNRS
jgi:hypothetical protein